MEYTWKEIRGLARERGVPLDEMFGRMGTWLYYQGKPVEYIKHRYGVWVVKIDTSTKETWGDCEILWGDCEILENPHDSTIFEVART